MTKYRKKPIVVEAEQWYPGVEISGVILIDFDTIPYHFKYGISWSDNAEYGWIKTLEGGMLVSPGDWIITGVRNEKYPCKDDIFKMTYELVGDE